MKIKRKRENNRKGKNTGEKIVFSLGVLGKPQQQEEQQKQ